MEVISALLQEKYHVEIELKEPTVIYMERPLKCRIYHSHRSAAKSFLGFPWFICITASVGKWKWYESWFLWILKSIVSKMQLWRGYAMAVNK